MRYLIFGGPIYYASGGAYDFIEGTDSLERAKLRSDEVIGQYAQRDRYPGAIELTVYPSDEIEWAHVFDTQEGEVVHHSGVGPHDQRERIRAVVSAPD